VRKNRSASIPSDNRTGGHARNLSTRQTSTWAGRQENAPTDGDDSTPRCSSDSTERASRDGTQTDSSFGAQRTANSYSPQPDNAPRAGGGNVTPADTPPDEQPDAHSRGRYTREHYRQYIPSWAAGPDARTRKGRPHKEGFVKRTVNQWWDRLLGAASSGSFGDQPEEYRAHRTDQDYIWNTIGLTAWGLVFPLLTIVITQLLDADQAGRFSLAFVTASLLMIIANYGVRTYQVSDIDERFSFTDYQVNRWLTCVAMMAIGLIVCQICHYEGDMLAVCVWVFLYKMIDGLADVYEGRLQQMDKLYLAGVSVMLRSVAAFVVFTICLFITRNLVISSAAMTIMAIASFVLYTFPLALLETPGSGKIRLKGVLEIFKQCFPVFLALFLYAFIDNMPKFFMGAMLTYDNQLYFNALYFPATTILLVVGFIYKPLIVRMANLWADRSQRKKFDRFIMVFIVMIAALTVVAVLLMDWIGIPLMGWLYGIDFEQLRGLSLVMIGAGGITAGIDFLYQVITVMRRNDAVMKLYFITFGFALLIPWLLIRFSGLGGAVYSYLIVMSILFVLLLLEYIGCRADFARHPENDPTFVFPAAHGK